VQFGDEVAHIGQPMHRSLITLSHKVSSFVKHSISILIDESKENSHVRQLLTFQMKPYDQRFHLSNRPWGHQAPTTDVSTVNGKPISTLIASSVSRPRETS
jgi:hypothetical protein